mmetsp:Transcript_10575/g.19515  ORF Transcript_10575/g.19515 Transcript_10575/m.19515 type:complete len:496 (+) Transcript_10575:146-1633(+)
MALIKLKWSGKVFDDVEVDPSKGAVAFKQALCDLTGVPVERQKVMAKGLWKGTLKDSEDIASMNWKDGQLIAMMGTADASLIKAPEEKTVFVEDMSAQEKQKVAAVDPPGLVNLGNTCYMNATLQCLRNVPEFRDSLDASPLNSNSADISEKMVVSLRDLYKQMDSNTDEVTPYTFVQTMRMTFPDFAEQARGGGGFVQQDADEFYNRMLTVLEQRLSAPGPNFDFGNKGDAVNALFGIEMTNEIKCIETDEEPVSTSKDLLKRLQCDINAETVTVEQGLKLAMEADIEKNSQVLGRNALFKQTRRIHKLPKYLAIQQNRFFWKLTPNSRDHQGVNCKILKSVKFSLELDVFDMCDESLQETLKGPREAYLRKRMGREKKTGDDGAGGEADDVDMAESDPELQAALQMSMGNSTESAGIGLPPNFRGNYELFGIVTHKGRASDSGHYVAWVKQKENDWICFDDETISHYRDEDILLLSGGGDRAMCYLCFYRAIV